MDKLKPITNKQIRPLCYVLFFILTSFVLSSCDSSNDECVGTTGSFPCGSTMLRFTGQGRIGCEQCTSNLRSGEFAIRINADVLPGGGIGSVINIFDQTFFIEQFEDGRCGSLELLTTDDLSPAGTLEDIVLTDPDDIAFSVAIEGQEPEEVSCGFCWTFAKPLCAEESDDGGGPCVPFDSEELPNIECLAQFMLDSCTPISCGSELGHTPASDRNCEFVDCATLSCESIEFIANSFFTVRPGTLTDIHLDETGSLAATTIRDAQAAPATCGIVVP